MKRATAPSQESVAGHSAARRAEAPDSHLSMPKALPGPSTESAFPTEARIQQKAHLKALKAQGLKPKTRKVVVEDHRDDCGTSLASLAAYLPKTETVHLAHWALYQHSYNLPPYWLLGSSAGPGLPPQPTSCFLASSFEHALQTLSQWPKGDSEICVLSGGHAQQALWCVRRRVGSGRYLSLATILDPTVAKCRTGLRSYVLSSRPLVCVLLPTWHNRAPNPLTPICEEMATTQKLQFPTLYL